MYKIYDNYHEKLLEKEFNTYVEADKYIEKLSIEHKKNRQSYDYDIVEND